MPHNLTIISLEVSVKGKMWGLQV